MNATFKYKNQDLNFMQYCYGKVMGNQINNVMELKYHVWLCQIPGDYTFCVDTSSPQVNLSVF